MLPCSPWKPALLGGRGLLRISLTRADVDDEGVAAGD